MNSSISASDLESSRLWRHWLLWFVAATAGMIAGLYAFILILDPFSSGKLTPIQRIDFVTANQLYSNAGRVRDLQFDAAIVGNSHAVRIMPESINRETGRHFAMLAVEGTWPSEQIFLMQQFDRHRSGAMFVVVLDDAWCSPKIGHGSLVPRWLYDESRLPYASRILSNFSLRSAWQRFLIIAGIGTQRQRTDGYDAHPWQPWNHEQMRMAMLNMLPSVDGDLSAPFPYFDELDRALPGFRPETSILFVFTPVYAKHLPVPGSNADTRLTRCKERTNAIAQVRPRTSVLDLRIDGPKVRNVENFIDVSHYNEDLARDIEAAIRQRIADMQRAASR